MAEVIYIHMCVWDGGLFFWEPMGRTQEEDRGREMEVLDLHMLGGDAG